jgi:uncharacterized protein (DUF2267 family)
MGTFDHMEHAANAWLADIGEVFGTKDRRFAYRLLRAWLHALRDRLTVECAAQFAAQLPELLRGVYYEGWNPGKVPVKYGPDEFVDRFARVAIIPADDVRWTAARISLVMQAHFSQGQLEHAVAQLPVWLREIMNGVDVPREVVRRPDVRAVEDRLGRLEDKVSGLTEVIRTLTHGLEEHPGSEPNEQRAAKAARQAHELMLAAKM